MLYVFNLKLYTIVEGGSIISLDKLEIEDVIVEIENR